MLLDLSVRSFRFLLGMAESERMSATAEVVEDRAGAEAPALIAHGLLVPGPNLTAVKAWPGDDEYREILETDAINGTVTCFHPDSGFVTLSDECLRTWRLDPGRLAVFLGRQLGLPASFKPVPVVDGLLWDLGTPRLDRTNTPVLFARRLGNEASRLRIRSELKLRRGSKQSALLTTAQRVDEDLVLPAVATVVPVVDTLVRGSDVARLDTSRLAAMIGVSSPVVSGPQAPVECEDNGRWIRIHGKTYQFGDTQGRVVRVLYDAWEAGGDWLREQDVLEQVDSGSTQIRRLFSRRADWHEVIEAHRGNCRLRVDPAAHGAT